jgi:hypothetical protein
MQLQPAPPGGPNETHLGILGGVPVPPDGLRPSRSTGLPPCGPLPRPLGQCATRIFTAHGNTDNSGTKITDSDAPEPVSTQHRNGAAQAPKWLRHPVFAVLTLIQPDGFDQRTGESRAAPSTGLRVRTLFD